MDEYSTSDLDSGLLSEEPNPDAERPTGMCGSPTKCERCPSDFLCYMKAKKEFELIKARSS